MSAEVDWWFFVQPNGLFGVFDAAMEMGKFNMTRERAVAFSVELADTVERPDGRVDHDVLLIAAETNTPLPAELVTVDEAGLTRFEIASRRHAKRPIQARSAAARAARGIVTH